MQNINNDSQKLHEQYILDEYQKIMNEKISPKKKHYMSRLEMEKKFLSALMADLGSSDWADTKIKYDHVSWRVFKDRRHQILWRALMEIDIPNFEGRLDILLKEQQDAGKEINLEECEDKAKPNNWFMRELKNAGVLKLAGGEKFVQEVLDIYSVSFQVDNFAKILFKSVHPNKL